MKNKIYYKMCIPIKKFYVVDYVINYLIDLDTANRYLNEPYLNPILDEICDYYTDTEFTINEVMIPYFNELADKIENAENNYARITEHDYQFLTQIYKVLKEYHDLDLAYFLCSNELTVQQHELIIEHNNRFQE